MNVKAWDGTHDIKRLIGARVTVHDRRLRSMEGGRVLARIPIPAPRPEGLTRFHARVGAGGHRTT
jgi:hypothetical protein